MPNGGSDCCGTCWFNPGNRGRYGYPPANEDVEAIPATCRIRDDVRIERPFYTYCANHPHHNRNKIDVPVGPVYIHNDADGGRDEWLVPLDTEDLRVKLVALLDAMPEDPEGRYFNPSHFDTALIGQLIRFKETRAVPGLHRVARFDPSVGGGTRQYTIGAALEALGAICGERVREILEEAASGFEQFEQIQAGAKRGLAHLELGPFDQ